MRAGVRGGWGGRGPQLFEQHLKHTAEVVSLSGHKVGQVLLVQLYNGRLLVIPLEALKEGDSDTDATARRLTRVAPTSRSSSRASSETHSVSACSHRPITTGCMSATDRWSMIAL